MAFQGLHLQSEDLIRNTCHSETLRAEWRHLSLLQQRCNADVFVLEAVERQTVTSTLHHFTDVMSPLHGKRLRIIGVAAASADLTN